MRWLGYVVRTAFKAAMVTLAVDGTRAFIHTQVWKARKKAKQQMKKKVPARPVRRR